jgi:hypothetical protein
MSAIFPTEPAKVHIHSLPTQSEFISYQVQPDMIRLKAWMPNGFARFKVANSETQRINCFYESNCIGCRRNSRQYIMDTYPDIVEDGPYGIDINWNAYEKIARDPNINECSVFYAGWQRPFRHWVGTCPEGNVYDESDNDADYVSVSNMVFECHISHNNKDLLFEKINDTAYLCAGKVDDNNQVVATKKLSVSNVYGGEWGSYLGGPICWGSVTTSDNQYDYTRPRNLREISTSYFSSQTNNDLLNLQSFASNCEDMRKHSSRKTSFKKLENDTFLCAGYDTLIMISADTDVQAFFTMLMAGFKPLPQLPHVMIVPARTSSIQRGDDLYLGFVTMEDSVGRQWYVSTEGYLIGQLDESFVCAS